MKLSLLGMPDDFQTWPIERLENVARIQTGLAKGKKVDGDALTLPYLRVANVQDGYVDLSEIKQIRIKRSELNRYKLQSGDVLFTEGGDFDKLGRGTVWNSKIHPCLHQNLVFVVRVNTNRLLPEFLSYLSSSTYGRRYFVLCSKQNTNLASINSTQLKQFPVLLPPLSEQRRVVEILRTWDDAIKKSSSEIEGQTRHLCWLTNQLVFGSLRFRNFGVQGINTSNRWFDLPSDWRVEPIATLAEEISESNGNGGAYEVLSCTKRDGFVRSLDYFKKRVFSEDLSGYKCIYRGDFGFPGNHIEEGSIGLQELSDVGLVSPIYTVFRFDQKSVDNRFAIRVLKTRFYQHIFEISTSASVDRRGSLRWREFRKIPIPLPSLKEQQAISVLLDTQTRLVELLRQCSDALQRQKRGLMQKLLTGEWRVPESMSEADRASG